MLQDKVRTSTTNGNSGPVPRTPGAEADDVTNLENLRRQQQQAQSLPSESIPPVPLNKPSSGQTAGAAALAANPEDMPAYANINFNGKGLTLEASDGYLVPNTPVAMNYTMNGLHNDSREYANVSTSAVMANGLPHLPPKPLPSSAKQMGKDDRVFFRDDLVLPQPNGDLAAADDDTQINYVAVEFDSSQPLSSPAANGSRGRTQPNPPEIRGEYCTIDIDRTRALSNTAKQYRSSNDSASDSPVGVRKTRHNSSLSELNLAGLSAKARAKRNSVID